MSFPSRRSAALALLSLLAALGCSPGAAVAPDATADPVGVAAAGHASDALACGGSDGLPVEHPDWPLAAGGEAEFLPIPMNSLLTVGPTRFLFGISDASLLPLGSPEVTAAIELYALERDPEMPVASFDAAYVDTGLGHGLYRANVELDCAGEWGALITAQLPDGRTASQRLRFQVHPDGPTPAIGEPAPRSESLTASTPEELRRITTDPDPEPAAYQQTVAEAVTAGRPALVLFATPGFCQTDLCGPAVEVVKAVAREHAHDLGFVIVEPYELHMSENGLQPLLAADGSLQPVQAALDYGIPVEPYLFVVDAAGDVFATFEGVVGADELREVVEAVTGTTA